MDTESQQFAADNLLVDRVYTARVLAAWHFLRRARSLPLRQRYAQRLSDYPPNLLPIDDSKKGDTHITYLNRGTGLGAFTHQIVR